MTRKTIYFYGSLPPKGRAPIGGGEVGNFRTVRMLTSYGYTVKVIRKLRMPSSTSQTVRLLSYPFRTLYGIIVFFSVLLFGSRNGIVHISGFAGRTILNEYILVLITKFLGYRLLYEIRGGGIIEAYQNGNSSYRNKFDSILRKSDWIFSQGQENFPLIESICKRPTYHYPNCVEKGFYPELYTLAEDKTINLLFFGRIEPEKNILLVVDVASFLQKDFPGVSLTIIGKGEKKYVNQVKEHMTEVLKENTYSYIPGCSHDELKGYLENKHFFVFPSQQIREGQSNAVTEAMSYGIIPIASPQGFNRSTIGDDNLIVEQLSAREYAMRITEIVKTGKVELYSRFVRDRFLNNYTEEAVFAKSKKIYQEILGE